MTFLVCNATLFCHSCMNRNPVLVFSIGNRQSAIDKVFIPLTFILSPQGRGNFNSQFSINGFPLKFIPEKSGTGMTFLVCNATLFCHSCMNRNPVLVFSIGNQQSAIDKVFIPPHLYPLPAG